MPELLVRLVAPFENRGLRTVVLEQARLFIRNPPFHLQICVRPAMARSARSQPSQIGRTDLSCVSHHHFAEVLAQQQCSKRPDDILPAHNDSHLGCWRRVLTRLSFGSIFSDFTVHRDRDKPVAGAILKLDDVVA